MDPARQIATLVPLIQQITKLSWTNFIDTHSRWAEEVSSLCALAGAGVYASLQVASSHMYVNDSSNMHKVKNTKKRKSEKNKQRKETFSEDDDNVARAIIILCMDRDIRDRFAKFMKVATTAKKLFNGIAILKEAVSILLPLSFFLIGGKLQCHA